MSVVPKASVMLLNMQSVMNEPSITVSNDRTQVIDPRGTLSSGNSSLVPHLSVVEFLRLSQSLHLIRNGRVRIIGQIGSNFVISSRQHTRTRPPGDVEHLEMRSHLRHLNRIDRSHRVKRFALLGRSRECGKELFGRDVGRVEGRDGLSSSLGGDEFGGVGSFRIGESGRVEPSLNGRDLRLEIGFLLRCGRLVESEERCFGHRGGERSSGEVAGGHARRRKGRENGEGADDGGGSTEGSSGDSPEHSEVLQRRETRSVPSFVFGTASCSFQSVYLSSLSDGSAK